MSYAMTGAPPTMSDCQKPLPGAPVIGISDLLDAIHCGDCMELLPRIPDKSVDAVITDPPYGVTQIKWDIVQDLTAWWTEIKRVRKDNAAIVVNCCQPFTTDLINSNRSEFRYELIWEKTNVTNGLNAKRQPARNHENVCVFYDSQPTYNPQEMPRPAAHKAKIRTGIKRDSYNGQHYSIAETGERRHYDLDWLKPKTVIFVPSIPNRYRGPDNHPTEKPVGLLEYIVRTFTNPGDIVLDTYAGSGTTCVAAKKLSRHFIGMEKEARFCEIGNRRVAQEMCLGV